MRLRKKPLKVDIQLGYGVPFVALGDGDNLPVSRGFQGFSELYLSYQTKGFTPGGLASITLVLVLTDTDQTINFTTNHHVFTEIEPGINEGVLDQWIIFRNPNRLIGRLAHLTLTATDATVPSITATVQQNVVLVDANGP